ncbi:hypothetical protein NQ314_021148 [Rhamnusium bicolor]|uniref:Gag protein n=1 Tax=Rhamnusium bicolor TaxID=1586634 RepID=A0AAV8WJS1_9CUCU|nr:hypothetical protein NQ314_021148 [Rhamnusium bicolor]
MASSGPKFGPFNPETDDWTIYSEQLEQWFISTKIVEPTEKVANLLSVIGTQTYTLLRNLTFPELPASKSIAELLNLLSKQFCIPRNEWKEIRNFMEAAQEPQETVQDWSARVRKLAINCNFGTNLIYMLKVKVVTGMTKGKVFDRVIEEKQDEAMEKLTKLAVQKENWNERERAVNYVRNRNSNCARPRNSDKMATRTQQRHRVQPPPPSKYKHERQRVQDGGNYQLSFTPREDRNKCKCCGRFHQGTCRYRNYQCQKCGKKAI